jgi:o-succinylbenzoate synthase
MKLEGFKYAPYSIPFKSPFNNSSASITSRSGFIISILGEMGRVSFGETAPLPGFSTESFADAGKELSGIEKLVPGFEGAKDLSTLRKFIEEIKFFPSVSFGVEQAMTSMLLKRDRTLFKELFAGTNPFINVNAVIGLDDNALDTIKNKIKIGYATFKIKVGRNNFDDDLNLIKKIRAEAGDTIKIRLDANGKWNPSEAKLNLDKLSPYNIEYIEEPCRGIENLIALSKISPLPVAIDESLRNTEEACKIINETDISFLIIKPMILGGFFKTSELIAESALKNKNIIISSSFETPLGKSLLVLLASLTHHSYAHGLDTIDFFDNNLPVDPYKVEAGKINFDINTYPPQFEYNKL